MPKSVSAASVSCRQRRKRTMRTPSSVERPRENALLKRVTSCPRAATAADSSCTSRSPPRRTSGQQNACVKAMRTAPQTRSVPSGRSLSSRFVLAMKQRAKRLTRRGTGPPILHCAHHKVGTTWFGKVLSSVAEHHGLRYLYWPASTPPDPADVYLLPHTRFYRALRDSFPPFRGTHMVRDPRDVVVSAYHYHLWTDEPWANMPRDDLGGRTYREHLSSLDPGDGLLVELERTCNEQVGEMTRWDYEQPHFLELRYEDLIDDEQGGFARVFEHYGFSDAAVERSMRFVEAASFKASVGRAVGEVAEGSHLRSGRPGEWREAFEPRHVARMKELAGDALVQLGYERDQSWSA